MGDSVTEAVASRPEDDAAMRATAETLTQLARLAALHVVPSEMVHLMGEKGLANASVSAALNAVMRSTQSQRLGSYEALGFAVGLALGEILKSAESVDLGAVTERLGEGISVVLASGMPQTTGGMQ